MWKKKLYVKDNLSPFTLSRTKVDLFFDCQRCFYLDQRFGVRRPHGTPLVINNTIVERIKNRLNKLRENQTTIPEGIKINRTFVPIQNDKIVHLRNSFSGISFIHKDTNLRISGVIDDIWLDEQTKKYHCIIIKSTSKKTKLTYDQIWPGYWKQLELYTYILSMNKIPMSETGILLYINAIKSENAKQDELKFEFDIFEKGLDLSWVNPTILRIFEVLNENKIPENSKRCKFCNYFFRIKEINEKL